jgi:DNA adenine methylase
MKTNTVIGYAGGKTKLKKDILPIIENYYLNNPQCKSYYEPLFGGGAIGLELLKNDKIDNFYFADSDATLMAMWFAIQYQHEALIDLLEKYTPSVEKFFEFRDELIKVVDIPLSQEAILDIGFKKIVLHQTSFSSMGMRGSVMGGINQSSSKVGDRYKPKNLKLKINNINKLCKEKNVQFIHANFFDVLHIIYPNTFIYFDPPYVNMGKRVYKDYFELEAHYKLKEYIDRITPCSWLLSYDDNDFIRELYKDCEIKDVSLFYTITANNRSNKKSELLIRNKEGSD